jgi:hypothetical protein
MSVYPSENYRKQLKSSFREIKILSLQAQLQFLEALVARHQLWVNEAEKPELASIHLEIIDLVHKLIHLYKRLYDTYHLDDA